MSKPKCPKCGHHVSPADNFCPSCGTRLQSESAADEKAPPGGGRRGCKAAVVSFAIVIVCGAAALAGWWYYRQQEPEQRVVTQSLRDAANSYETLGEFYHGVAQCRRGDAIFYIDTSGMAAEPPSGKTSGHTPDETSLLRVEKGGRWGMIDKTTRDTVIRPIYSTLGNFYDGFALASIKFGDPTMPEYRCFYGYVDVYGNHTFTPAQFDEVERAAALAARREYIESLPKGITTKTMGLSDGTRRATITSDFSEAVWTLVFDNRGVLTQIACDDPEREPVSYGVSDGFVTSATVTGDGVIRTSRYLREKIDDRREAIICHSSSGRRNAGNVVYSPDDGTVVSWTFESLPSPSDPGVTVTLQ